MARQTWSCRSCGKALPTQSQNAPPRPPSLDSPTRSIQESAKQSRAVAMATAPNRRIAVAFVLLICLSMSATALLWSMQEIDDAAQSGDDGRDGEEGFTTLLLVETEQPGHNCANGGHAVLTGLDRNRDGALHLDEVDKTSFICNGAESPELPTQGEALTDLEAVSFGNDTCLEGGLLIRTGLDDDGDGNLSEEEVQAQQMICNGPQGQQGEDGEDGEDGTAHDPIMHQDSRATMCPDGLRMRFGVDDGAGTGRSGDRVLQSDEVHSLMVMCWVDEWNHTYPDYFTGVADSFSTACDERIDYERWFVFTVITAASGCELYISDGTENGTSMILDINNGGESRPAGLSGLTVWRGLLWFDADDGVNGRELWVSDGTSSGTRMAADICPGSCSSNPGQSGGIYGHGDSIWFSADDGTSSGAELWSFDTIAENSRMVADICTGTCSSNPGAQGWASLGNILYLSGHDGNTTRLLRFDDSLVALDGVGADVGMTHGLFVHDSLLYFDAVDDDEGRELMIHDGANTSIHTFDSTSDDSLVSDSFGFQIINNHLLLQAQGTLYRLDSTPTALNSSLLDIGGDAAPAVLDGKLWFACQATGTGVELCATDGTSASIVHEFIPGIGSASISSMVEMGGFIHLVADGMNGSTETGQELWRFSTSGAPELIFEGQSGSASGEIGYYGGLTAVGNTLFFSYDDGTRGHELKAMGWLPDDSSHLLMTEFGS